MFYKKITIIVTLLHNSCYCICYCLFFNLTVHLLKNSSYSICTYVEASAWCIANACIVPRARAIQASLALYHRGDTGSPSCAGYAAEGLEEAAMFPPPPLPERGLPDGVDSVDAELQMALALSQQEREQEERQRREEEEIMQQVLMLSLTEK